MLLSLLVAAPSPYRPLPGDPGVTRKPVVAKEVGVKPGSTTDRPCVAGRRVTKLPFAAGRSFCTLDDYLAHLEYQAAIDLPWWRQVRPGVYEHVKRMPGATREIATRAELMKRFGFTS